MVIAIIAVFAIRLTHIDMTGTRLLSEIQKQRGQINCKEVYNQESIRNLIERVGLMRLEKGDHGNNQHNLLDKSDNIQTNRQRGRIERHQFEFRFILDI